MYLEIDKDVVPLCAVDCLQMSVHFEILFSGSVKKEMQHLNVDLHVMKCTVGYLVNCIFNFPIWGSIPYYLCNFQHAGIEGSKVYCISYHDNEIVLCIAIWSLCWECKDWKERQNSVR